MPELPEVETVVRGLQETISGLTISRVVCRDPKINRDNPRKWKNRLRNQKVLGIRRRGKNILIDLTGQWSLWVHLKMTGHLYFRKGGAPVDRHDRLIVHWRNCSEQLRFHDFRRFGRVRLFPTANVMQQKGLKELGPEPLDISSAAFIDMVRDSRRMIKPALLDQRFVAGIGNIYADESLYRARIHPRRLTHTLSRGKAAELHRHIRQVLMSAIAKMGTSVDSYAGVNGQPGGYQKYLAVYGREGEVCTCCGSRIKREVIGSRSAHYCPRCQRIR